MSSAAAGFSFAWMDLFLMDRSGENLRKPKFCLHNTAYFHAERRIGRNRDGKQKACLVVHLSGPLSHAKDHAEKERAQQPPTGEGL